MLLVLGMASGQNLLRYLNQKPGSHPGSFCFLIFIRQLLSTVDFLSPAKFFTLLAHTPFAPWVSLSCSCFPRLSIPSLRLPQNWLILSFPRFLCLISFSPFKILLAFSFLTELPAAVSPASPFAPEDPLVDFFINSIIFLFQFLSV